VRERRKQCGNKGRGKYRRGSSEGGGGREDKRKEESGKGSALWRED